VTVPPLVHQENVIMPELESLTEVNQSLDEKLARIRDAKSAYRASWLAAGEAESARVARLEAAAQRRVAEEAAERVAATAKATAAARTPLVTLYGEAAVSLAEAAGCEPGIAAALLSGLGSRRAALEHVESRRARGEQLLPCT